ncbi:uncharacterized protein UTRI_10388_B [Ustilago trichophora]|uniref:Uncharacterized protein n=1 Tax=Ustilago trichophora TaxID=86804 RepID=A0A5C3E8W7_9BASI|nr:uncharacterized protein UTRI_10388_B [Ustilago trichophora]
MVSSIRHLILSFILFATLIESTFAAWPRAVKSRQAKNPDNAMIMASRIIDADVQKITKQPWLRPTTTPESRKYPSAPNLPEIAWGQAFDEAHGFLHVGKATEYPSRWRKWLLGARPEHYVYLSSKVYPGDDLANTMKLEKGKAASLVWKYNPRKQRKELVFVEEFKDNPKVSWPGLPLEQALEPWEAVHSRLETAEPLQQIEKPLQEIVENVH